MPRTRTPAPPGHKHCHRCSKSRPSENFARDASKSDGLRVCCRQCDAKRLKAAYWTWGRKKARKLRKAVAERRSLERQHGPLWIAKQEQLKAEEEKARRDAEQREHREAAAGRFWARLRARQGSGDEEA